MVLILNDSLYHQFQKRWYINRYYANRERLVKEHKKRRATWYDSLLFIRMRLAALMIWQDSLRSFAGSLTISSGKYLSEPLKALNPIGDFLCISIVGN